MVVSLHADPLHAGHLDYIEASAGLGDVIAIVNSDAQCVLKKGYFFQPEQERLRIVGGLRWVHAACIAVDDDRSVGRTLVWLRHIYQDREMIFCNGGDVRDESEVREAGVCKELGIGMIFGVGGDKVQSSSALVARARGQQ